MFNLSSILVQEESELVHLAGMQLSDRSVRLYAAICDMQMRKSILFGMPWGITHPHILSTSGQMEVRRLCHSVVFVR